MPKAEIENGEITVQTEFRDKHAIKSIPGSKWSQSGSWRLPLSWASCVSLRGVFGERLEIGPDLLAWATKERAERIEPSMALRSALEADGDERLFPPCLLYTSDAADE